MTRTDMPSQSDKPSETQTADTTNPKTASASTERSDRNEGAKQPRPKLKVDTHAAQRHVRLKSRGNSPENHAVVDLDPQKWSAPKVPNPENMTEEELAKLFADRADSWERHQADSETQTSQGPASLSASMQLDQSDPIRR